MVRWVETISEVLELLFGELPLRPCSSRTPNDRSGSGLTASASDLLYASVEN